jgi:hypothetical protein
MAQLNRNEVIRQITSFHNQSLAAAGPALRWINGSLVMPSLPSDKISKPDAFPFMWMEKAYK